MISSQCVLECGYGHGMASGWKSTRRGTKLQTSTPLAANVPCQVGGVDLTLTVLELVGIADTVEREGTSRMSELGGGECRERPVYSSTVAGRLVADPPTDHALRGQGRKLIVHEGGPVALFDLAADPGETVNLAPSPVSDGMRKLLDARIAGAPLEAPELDPLTTTMLQSLGYIE